MARRRRNNKPQIPFSQKLALNQWLLSLFNVDRFEQLAEHLRGEALQGLDENNIHHFHHALTAQLFNLTQLPTDLLLEYDQNIVRHTQRLNERRITRGEEPIAWKYFQYLSLLFTEIYLDRYFRDPDALLQALNEQVSALNADSDRGRLHRALGRGRRSLAAAQQAGVLDGHRQRQDVADARQHPPIPALSQQARPSA